MKDIHYFAVNILIDFILRVASLLKSIEQLSIVASEQHNQLEPSLREEITTVELEDYPTFLAHNWLELITDHVYIEFWNIKLLIPRFV